MILEPKKIKSVTLSTFFPFIYYEVMGPDAIILVGFFLLLFCFLLMLSLKPVSIQFSSVHLLHHDWLTVTPWTTCSMPDFPVHYQLPDLAQTHVHPVSDTIQPSHPLSSPSPPALNISQHRGLFQWVRSSHQVAKALEFQLQHQSFQWIFRTDFLYNWLVGSPCCPRWQSKTFCTTPRGRYNWRYNFHWT